MPTEIVLASDSSCATEIFSNKTILRNNRYGESFWNFGIPPILDFLSVNYICEYRNNLLQSSLPLVDSFLNRLFVKNITADYIRTNNLNISGILYYNNGTPIDSWNKTSSIQYLINGNPLNLSSLNLPLNEEQILFMQEGIVNGSQNFLFNDTTNQLTLNRNLASAGTPTITGTAFRINGADNEAVRIGITSYGIGGTAGYSVRSSRGNGSIPTSSIIGDLLGQFDSYGRGATSWSLTPRAIIKMVASENYTDSAQGAYLSFWTTPKGSLVPSESMRIDNGNVTVNGNINSSNAVYVQNSINLVPAYIETITNRNITATNNIWYNVSFDTMDDLTKKDINHTFNDNTNDTFIITRKGVYSFFIFATIQDSASSPSATVGLRVLKNNIPINGSGVQVDTKKQASTQTITESVLANVTENDRFKMQFRGTANTVTMLTPTNNILDNPVSAQISIRKVG